MAIKKGAGQRNLFREKIVLITGVVAVLVVGFYVYQNNRSGAINLGPSKGRTYPVYIAGIQKATNANPYSYLVNIWAQPSFQHESIPGSGVEGNVTIMAGVGKPFTANVFAYTAGTGNLLMVDAIIPENQRKIRCRISPAGKSVSVACSYYPTPYPDDHINPIPLTITLDASTVVAYYPQTTAKLTIEPVAERPLSRKVTITENGVTSSLRNFYFYCSRTKGTTPTLPITVGAYSTGDAYFGQGKTLTANTTCQYNKAGTYSIVGILEDNDGIQNKTAGKFATTFNNVQISNTVPTGSQTVMMLSGLVK